MIHILKHMKLNPFKLSYDGPNTEKADAVMITNAVLLCITSKSGNDGQEDNKTREFIIFSLKPAAKCGQSGRGYHISSYLIIIHSIVTEMNGLTDTTDKCKALNTITYYPTKDYFLHKGNQAIGMKAS